MAMLPFHAVEPLRSQRLGLDAWDLRFHDFDPELKGLLQARAVARCAVVEGKASEARKKDRCHCLRALLVGSGLDKYRCEAVNPIVKTATKKVFVFLTMPYRLAITLVKKLEAMHIAGPHDLGPRSSSNAAERVVLAGQKQSFALPLTNPDKDRRNQLFFRAEVVEQNSRA